MDKQMNLAPCGFLTLSKEGIILNINQTLLNILNYDRDQLIHEHTKKILSRSSSVFFELYFMPLIIGDHHVEEMYLSLVTQDGEEVPILINASLITSKKDNVISCVIVPIPKREEFETQLLHTKKALEESILEKDKAFSELETTLNILESKQAELLEITKLNNQYKHELEEELELAKKIQQTTLPKDIKNESIEIVSYYEASQALSGDLYGLYKISPHQYGIILLDVMGHGISSALITMSLHSLFQRMMSEGYPAQEMVQELDSYLHLLFENNEEAWHYCTSIYLMIDTKKKIIEYTNAGHPPAVLLKTNGEYHNLSAQTPPIGMFSDTKFQTTTVPYNPGDRIFVYTDGVSEPFEMDELYHFVKKYSYLTLEQLKDLMLLKLKIKEQEFGKPDDKCFVLVDLK